MAEPVEVDGGARWRYAAGVHPNQTYSGQVSNSTGERIAFDEVQRVLADLAGQLGKGQVRGVERKYAR
jgi:hypothetical protein